MENIVVSVIVGAAIGYCIAAIYKVAKRLFSKNSGGCSSGSCDNCKDKSDGCC